MAAKARDVADGRGTVKAPAQPAGDQVDLQQQTPRDFWRVWKPGADDYIEVRPHPPMTQREMLALYPGASVLPRDCP